MFKCLFKILSCCFQSVFSLKRKGLALGVQVLLVFVSIQSYAFLSEILEVKKKFESYSSTVETVGDTLEDINKFKKVEDEYEAYEKDLKDFQETLDEYERLGLDVKDFIEFRAYNPSTLRGQIDFFKNYIRRSHRLLKSFQSLFSSPETRTAEEQVETNRTLRALLEDAQTRELRRLRRDIAKQKLLLERRKQEREFINKQYAYINRHSKKRGFGVFHPFQNSLDRDETIKGQKRKKFLGIF